MNKIDPNADLACELLFQDLMEKIKEIKNLSTGDIMTFGINVLKAAFNISESDIEEFVKDLEFTLNKWVNKM